MRQPPKKSLRSTGVMLIGEHIQFAMITVALALGLDPARADVHVPAIFGDHMVLQQSITLPVWGIADPGEKVAVTVGSSTGSTTASADGKWRIDLVPLKASKEPVTMTVAGHNTLTFSDVLIGEVWLCSGQSNMEFAMTTESHAAEELPKADNPLIRLFIVRHRWGYLPLEDVGLGSSENSVEGHWKLCTAESLTNMGGWGGFSAVAYYFGREVQATTKQPVGLLQSAFGGKPIEAFISLEALNTEPAFASYVAQHEKEEAAAPALKAAATAGKAEYAAQLKAWNDQHSAAYQQALEEWAKTDAAARAAHAPLPPRPKPSVPMPIPLPDGNAKPDTPTHLFNGMIHPLIPFGIKGVIWYQGENNAGRPWDYDKLMATMIADWRTRWAQGDFPFLYVQLASFQTPAKEPVQKDGWPVIRDMQLRTLKVPNTGMAVAIDIGETNDIHPRDKLDVGHRLALAARRIAYGEDIEYSGPIYDHMEAEGDQIRIHFKHDRGLKSAAHPKIYPDVPAEAAPAELKAFAIAGADRKWVSATAVIDDNTVVVSSDLVKQPVAARYGWAKHPACHLYNGADLPASPFRTDDWTEAAR
jgi:sialate O-acetylesterase